jgi:bifunctional DNA-binding transcriptional regulator/antitoxin component of YhaV-PrlF toxin-antitoxin module
MAVERVRPGGEISLPAEVQKALGLATGDLIRIDVTERGTAEIRRIRPLRFAEALERYRIEGPINEAAGREAWQDRAARDVFRSREAD